MKRWALLLALLPVLPGFAQAAQTVVRIGDHPGFGRVVFDLPAGATAHVTREGDRILLRFDGAGPIGTTSKVPHNVLQIAGGDSQAEITIQPGARIRQMRLGTRLVIDVLDPPHPVTGKLVVPKPVVAVVAQSPAQPSRPASRPAASTATPMPGPASAPAVVQPVQQTPLPAPASTPPPPSNANLPPSPASKPAMPAPTEPQPAAEKSGVEAAASPALVSSTAPLSASTDDTLALAAQPALLPPGVAGHAIMVPFGKDVGVAAFRRGDVALLIFDAKRPIDLSALRGDAVFGGARVQLLPAATMLRFDLPSDELLRLARAPEGWTVTVRDTAPPLTPIRPQADGAALALLAAEVGRVVVVPDPETGQDLLVGTQRVPGQGVSVARRTPEYALGPTWQGVVVEPYSDRLSLRTGRDRFVLSATGMALSLAPADPAALLAADAAGLTRRFDFADLPVAALRRRMLDAVDDAAAAPPLARFAPRYAAAQAMVALGMGPEAASLLHLAMAQDPRHADDANAIGLTAIAELVAGREAAAAGLDDPRLTGSDEIALWRALRTAQREQGAPEAAPVLAATLPLLLTYPAPLRDRFLPPVAETLVRGGAVQAAAALLARRPTDHTLDYARGLLAEKTGNTDGALHIFDTLASSPDQRTSARAAARAVMVRADTGKLDAAAAARALEGQFLAWRGDGHELKLRLAAAALFGKAHDWRQALDLLQQTEAIFPHDRAAIQAARHNAFAAMLHDPKAVPPLDLVTLAGENADLVPSGAAGEALASLLADRLLALDLPGRAEIVLAVLLQGTPPGPARAAIGARLAELQLQDGDASRAAATLAGSDVPALPMKLAEARILLGARVFAAEGKAQPALASLAGLDTPAADDLRATILASVKDWPAAEAALQTLVRRTVPDAGALDLAQQRLLVRLASAAAEADDDAGLATLRTAQGTRITDARLVGLFRLLTAPRLDQLSRLPTLSQDIAEAQALPASLAAIGGQ